MALCHGPVDAVSAITVDGKKAWTGSVNSNADIYVNKPDLFGGLRRGGGVSGRVAVLMGEKTQAPDSYLLKLLPGLVPAYRGVVSAVLSKIYIGNSPYLKPWAFRVQRIHKRGVGGKPQWYPSKAEIGGEGQSGTMNPAHIIFDCLTDSEWGLGYYESDLDITSFTVAANRLYAENFGLCLLWSRQASISDFIINILAHIDAAVYVDRASGKFVLKLIRDDFDPAALVTLDENNIIELREFIRPTVAELTSAVTVQFWNMSTGNDDSLTIHDLALAQQQGAVISTTKQYPGIPNAELASRVAARDLKGVSTPLIACTITANRTASGLNIGDVFKLSWSKYGIVSVVMRVVKLGFGMPNDSKVTIECVQDIFSLSDAIYAPPPPTDWQSPISDPQAVTLNVIRESPYYELAQRLGDVKASELKNGEGYVVGSGVRPTRDAINAGLHLGAGNVDNLADAGETDFCATALLNAPVNETDTTFELSSAQALETVSVGSWFEIGDEYAQLVSISGSSLIVARGVLDTIPRKHAKNTPLYFWEDFAETDSKIYLENETVYMKLTPVTGNGELNVANATTASVTMNNRAFRPYPPGDVKINNEKFPETIASSSDPQISWAHRDRLQQTSTLIGFFQSSVGLEPGAGYHLEIIDENEVTVVSVQTTNSTHTYSSETTDLNTLQLPPAGVYASTQAVVRPLRRNGKLTYKLKTQRDGVDCLYEYSHTVYRRDYGYNYGKFYGDI